MERLLVLDVSGGALTNGTIACISSTIRETAFGPEDFLLWQSLANSEVSESQQLDVGIVCFIALSREVC